LLIELALGLGLLGLLLLAYGVGQRWGRVDDHALAHVGVVQGAVLGLLGLLIGFSFSGAVTRFGARQDLIVREANAIETTALRADFLPVPQREALRDALRQYTRARLELVRADAIESRERLAQLQDRIWAITVQGVTARSEFAQPVLETTNEMFDLLAARNATASRHIPPAVVVVMIACATLASAMISYGQARREAAAGKGRGSQVPAVALVVLFAAVLWLTLDLDFPQHGFVRLGDGPLRAVLARLEAMPV
jgi:hypothetical protein